jgi:hypothetical protein
MWIIRKTFEYYGLVGLILLGLFIWALVWANHHFSK